MTQFINTALTAMPTLLMQAAGGRDVGQNFNWLCSWSTYTDFHPLMGFNSIGPRMKTNTSRCSVRKATTQLLPASLKKKKWNKWPHWAQCLKNGKHFKQLTSRKDFSSGSEAHITTSQICGKNLQIVYHIWHSVHCTARVAAHSYILDSTLVTKNLKSMHWSFQFHLFLGGYTVENQALRKRSHYWKT